jgi:hypothetical protein
VVSVFAILGDVVKPESLGGVFAAAPTIALATLILTMHKHGGVYVATEARSMVAGAVAFFAYACVVSFVLMRWRPKALMTATAVLPLAVSKIPDGPGWTYEIKLDGYRLEVVRSGGETTLFSRRKNVLNRKFHYVARRRLRVGARQVTRQRM